MAERCSVPESNAFVLSTVKLIDSFTHCFIHSLIADWLRGVQFLEVMALFLLLLACVFAVLLNFAQRALHMRLLELFAGFGGE